MGTLARHHLRMARANRLANHRLHGACLKLSHDEWVAPRTSFFPSIAATLHHILVVDRYYLDGLEEGGVGRAVFANALPCATMADLAERQRATDLRLIGFCERLADAGEAASPRLISLDRGASGVVRESVDTTLAHLFMHATHHRGQVHAMLSGSSIVPPQLDDFIMTDDARFRVADLAANGMTEADLAP
jgi:uncharacterized damage-inducible protein DinB